MTAQQVAAACCCDEVEPPAECPGEPCDPCQFDVLTMDVLATGTASRDGFAYTWTVQNGTLQPTVRYVTGPGSLSGGCGWEWRSGNLSVVIEGEGPLAGVRSLSRDEDQAILLCEVGADGQLDSRCRVRASQNFGGDLIRADLLGVGTYVQCAAGFAVETIDQAFGIFIVPGSGAPFSSMTTEALSVTFA